MLRGEQDAQVAACRSDDIIGRNAVPVNAGGGGQQGNLFAANIVGQCVCAIDAAKNMVLHDDRFPFLQQTACSYAGRRVILLPAGA